MKRRDATISQRGRTEAKEISKGRQGGTQRFQDGCNGSGVVFTQARLYF